MEAPELQLCMCDKILVEKVCWYEEDAGRKYLCCPLNWDGCAYARWIEEPHESRAVTIIQELRKEISELQLKYLCEKERLEDKHREEINKMKNLLKKENVAIWPAEEEEL